MTCGECYYVGWTKGTCNLRCRHPCLDGELTEEMWKQGCDLQSPNKVIGEKRPDKIKPGCGKGENHAGNSK